MDCPQAASYRSINKNPALYIILCNRKNELVSIYLQFGRHIHIIIIPIFLSELRCRGLIANNIGMSNMRRRTSKRKYIKWLKDRTEYIDLFVTRWD